MMDSEHARENRRYWNERAPDWVASGERNWVDSMPSWGIWGVPNDALPLLPEDMRGLRAVELGCGTGYVSGWMAKRGARVTGIDLSEAQLATAKRLAAEHRADITFVHGNAEATPFDDGAFDFAISEYGAAIWCDPYVWIPEAWRILAPGGRLVFLAHHPMASVCSPLDGSEATERLERPYFGLHRLVWTEVAEDPGGIEFTLPIEAWFALFREVGFRVRDVREPKPVGDVDETRFFVSAAWARSWPSEIVWFLEKPA